MKTLESVVYVVRMDQGWTVTRILESKPEGIEEVEDLD
jgi:hypothetical protein